MVREMPADIAGVELGHARGADHDPGGAGGFRVLAVVEASVETIAGRADDHRDATVGVLHGCVEDRVTLAVVEPSDLAGHAEYGEPGDTVFDKQVDDAAKAFGIEVAVLVKRGRQNGVDTF